MDLLKMLSLLDIASYGKENNQELVMSILKFAQEINCYLKNDKDQLKKRSLYTFSIQKIKEARNITFYPAANNISTESIDIIATIYYQKEIFVIKAKIPQKTYKDILLSLKFNQKPT